ncbi:MAG: helix-turn-helix domain-containing protein [Alphaproteobacteria bacterium]
MPRKPTNRRNRDESDLSERMMIGAGRQATIGDDLRAARQARGEDLQDIAAQLRIRFVYLEAIENGAFDALPGPTYAIGFVRAYARYLRLDAEEMIARFKEEAAGIDAPAELSFPEPVSESRVPRGGLVVIALLLAIAAYGGWYYLSTRDMTTADLVPPVPDDFPGATASGPALLPPDIAEFAPPPPSEIPPAGLAPSDPAAALPTLPEAATPPETIPPQTAVAPAAPAPAPATTPMPAIPAVPSLTGPAPSPLASGSEAPNAPGTAAPPVSGEGNADARIVLSARGDSWVQIRAADDSLVMTRTLRAGDTYRVPTMSGLKLMTGNAGALDVLVDGQVTPSLGPYGAVRRNVVLDTERLKAGTAAPQ